MGLRLNIVESTQTQTGGELILKREREMLRRKASKIEVKLDDKEELEDSRKRAVAAAAASSTSASASASATTTTTAASSLLQHFDRSSHNPSSKSHRIGLSPS
ncbi:hypothetical protein ACH5RR_004390 [Cinchona calisaya]|uniref:Uncharacterized protein n=1 Tax=Cinchona calisaya TaxID=153742 RepID=A0ABD3AXI8_9GENT